LDPPVLHELLIVAALEEGVRFDLVHRGGHGVVLDEVDEPVGEATTCSVCPAGIWKTPKPRIGICSPLFSMTRGIWIDRFSTLGLIRAMKQALPVHATTGGSCADAGTGSTFLGLVAGS
jgi:hypothetical protein